MWLPLPVTLAQDPPAQLLKPVPGIQGQWLGCLFPLCGFNQWRSCAYYPRDIHMDMNTRKILTLPDPAPVTKG